jgi:phospholipase/carboxylesterase
VRPVADAWGLVIIAPHARGETWDLLAGRPSTMGPMARALRDADRPDRDAPRVRAAILAMSGKAAIDPHRIAVAGFSDGASYALTLGTGAPKLFDHVIVLSGGIAMIAPGATGNGRQVFVAHGTEDSMLSYAHARDEMVPKLRAAGFDVAFRSFAGPHVLYYRVFVEAIEDWLGSGRLVRHAPGTH